MGATLLCGCSAFTHNYDRDYRQVVAHIDSYEITNSVSVYNENGEKVNSTVTKTSDPVDIYKLDLVEFVANNRDSLSQNATDAQNLYDNALEMLVNTELVANEVDALIEAGLVAWDKTIETYKTDDNGNVVMENGKPVVSSSVKTYTQSNAVKKRVYSVIDSTLVTLKNDILEKKDKPGISTTGDSEVSTDTTYPVKPEENDDEDIEDLEPWEPSRSSYPGLSNDPEKNSLDREAIRQFIELLKSRVKDDFRVTEEDRKKFDEDDARFDEIIKTKGYEYIYPMLGDTHYVYYISGKSIERSQKISELQSYLTENVTVDDKEVVSRYENLLNDQKNTYTADASAYKTAMTGNDTVLYHANTNFFYVKHILLPFSDSQKAQLEDYKSRINVTKDQINAFRDYLVDGIVCYPHLYGEDDKSRPMTVKEVMADIKAKMYPLQSDSDIEKADLMFDDLIYLYNTDPGAFDNNKGYVVSVNEDDNSYMEEFTAGALKMRETLKPGEVLYENVVTDYGVHIMYFASVPQVGEVGLYDYTTPGKKETYFDAVKAPITTARQNAAYSTWEGNVLKYNFKTYVTLFENRYKNLWDN